VNPQRVLPFLAVFISGFAALVLQEIWSRFGVFIFGSTTIAITVVLATFMAGLAIGNAVAAKILHRVNRPFFVYGLIEFGVAFFAMILLFVLRRYDLVYQYPSASIILLLLVPTTLMGLTIPLVVSGITQIGSASSTLALAQTYGINTLGASIGALAGAFWLMPLLGLSKLTWVSIVIFCIAGFCGLSLRNVQRAHQESTFPNDEENDPQKSILILSIAFLSGACGLALEIVWTRLLSLVFGPSVYAFGLVLFVYLLGIGLGALLSPKIVRKNPKLHAVSACLIIGGFALGWSMMVFGVLPYAFLWLVEVIQPSPQGLRLIETFLLILTILPSAAVQGVMLPVLVSLYPRSKVAGKEAGWVLSVNTFGSIVGIVLTGLWIIPTFGFLPALLLIFALYLIVAVLLIHPIRNWGFSLLCLLLIAVFAGNAKKFWDRGVLASGVYKYAVGNALSGSKDTKIELGEVLYYREGIASTVAVLKIKNDLILSIDGKADASAFGDRSTQVLLGALPLSLSRNTNQVLVIGFASGVTAGVSSLFPGAQVTAVEIEPAVIEASKFFEIVNHGPLQSPKHQIVINDARRFLVTTAHKFDVITSEPSNPWMSGVAPLFTKEFFDLSRKHLAPGGVMCQWLPIYGMSTDLIQSVLKTFSSTYPNVLVFESVEGFDLLLIGSEDKILLHPDFLDRRWVDERLQKELESVQIHSGIDLMARFLMGTQGVKKFSKNAMLNTDDNGFLEFGAPRALHLKTAQENNHLLSLSSDGFMNYIHPDARTTEIKLALIQRLQRRGELKLARSIQ